MPKPNHNRLHGWETMPRIRMPETRFHHARPSIVYTNEGLGTGVSLGKPELQPVEKIAVVDQADLRDREIRRCE